MLTAFSQRDLVERARDAGVMSYVVKPFTIDDLVPAIEIALSRYQQLLALQDEISDLTERLETRKLVDQAKGILMKAMNLSEPEAFKWIQKSAMDRRITMKEISLAILDPNQATTVPPKLNK
jgi:response regulator NasT